MEYTVTDAAAKTVALTNARYDEGYGRDVVIPANVAEGGTEYMVTAVGDNAFYSQNWVSSVSLPESLTSIGSYAFSGTAIKEIDIPESVTSIGECAFANTAIVEALLPESITSVSNGLFSWCTYLAKVEFKGEITSIGQSAFGACFSLTGITIPESVTSIGDGAFFNCEKLMNVTVPCGKHRPQCFRRL